MTMMILVMIKPGCKRVDIPFDSCLVAFEVFLVVD
jgi:hypothetical protein